MRSPVRLSQEERQRLSNVFQSALTEARGANAGEVANIERWRAYYEEYDENDKPRWEGASVLRSPFCKTSLIAMMADLIPATLGVNPLEHYEGPGEDGRKCADRMEQLQHEMLTRFCHVERSVRQMIQNCLRDGSAFVMVSWEKRQRKRWEWKVAVEESDALTVGDIFADDAGELMTVYDWPRFDVIPIERVTMWPTQSQSIYDAPGIAVQSPLSADDLLQRVEQGIYDSEAVRKVLESAGQDTTITQTDPSQQAFGTQDMGLQSTDDHDKASAPITVTDVWYLYREGGKGLPQDWHVVIHEQTGEVLAAAPWQVWRADTPTPRPLVLVRPYQQSYGLFGDSLSSAGAGYTQDTKTQMFRQIVDMQAKNLEKRVFVDVSLYRTLQEKFGPQAMDKFRKPGSMIPVPREALTTRGMSTIDEGGHPGAALNILEYADRDGQRTGVNDTMQGVPQNRDMTATQSAQMMQSSQHIMAMVVGNIADAMTDLGNICHDLLIQHQGRDSVQKLWADINADYPGDEIPLHLALALDYQISANGVAEASSQSQQAAQAQQLFALLSQVPDVMLDTERRYALVKYVTDKVMSTRFPRDILGTPQEWAQSEQERMQQQMDLMAHQQVAQEGIMAAQGQPQPPPAPPAELAGGEM